MINIEKIKRSAIDAALEAGIILKEGFGTSFEISNKEGKNNLVTEYDHRSEISIINHLKQELPNSRFLAEESGSSGSENSDNILWVIDPLDGTVNFANNLPIFSISIAAVYKQEIIAGVVYHPILNELFVATKGDGASLNGNMIRISKSHELATSILVTGFPYNVNENPCRCIDIFVDVIKQGIPVRRLGSAALDLAYVAAGRFDGFWEIMLNPWDVAAGAILVEEAGGKVTQFNRDRFNINDETILATNGIIHEELSELLSTCRHYK